jgi:hypothetical protein
MSRAARVGTALGHGAAWAALILGLGGVFSLHDNLADLRQSLAARFRLTVVLSPKTSEVETRQAIESVEALEGVASVSPRDPESDQKALFAREPWAEEYRQALSTRFLPVVLDVALTDPYGDPRAVSSLLDKVQKIPEVSEAAYYRDAYDRTARAFALTERVFSALLGAAAALVILAALFLEIMRPAAEGDEGASWAKDRLAVGLGGAVVGIASVRALAWALTDRTGVALIGPSGGEMAILLALGVAAPIVAASIVWLVRRPFRARRGKPSESLAHRPESSVDNDQKIARTDSAQARAAYQKMAARGVGKKNG